MSLDMSFVLGRIVSGCFALMPYGTIKVQLFPHEANCGMIKINIMFGKEQEQEYLFDPKHMDVVYIVKVSTIYFHPHR